MNVTTTVWWSKNDLPNVAKGHEDWEQNLETGLNKRSCTAHTFRGKGSAKQEKWVRSPFHIAVAGVSIVARDEFHLVFYVEDGSHSNWQNGWLARGAPTVGRSMRIMFMHAWSSCKHHEHASERTVFYGRYDDKKV